MTSQVLMKPKRNPTTKKKTATSSSTRKPKPKVKEDLFDSDLEGSGSDEAFLREFESGDSDVSSSTGTDELSQEFSDEDRLMEYYEKKLREHATVGNVKYGSDIDEDSEPSGEFQNMVIDNIRNRADKQTEHHNQRRRAKGSNEKGEGPKHYTAPAGLLELSKKVTSEKRTNKLKTQMKSVITDLNSGSSRKKPEDRESPGPKLSAVTKKTPSERSVTLRKIGSKNSLTPSLSLEPRSDCANIHKAVNRTHSTSLDQPRITAANQTSREGKYSRNQQKACEYSTRIEELQHSISEMNRKMNEDSKSTVGLEAIKLYQTSFMKGLDCNRKRQQKKMAYVSGSTSPSATSGGDSALGEEQLKDEVVDQILNAVLGMSRTGFNSGPD